ncbi:hypothetical protein ACH4VT_03860 [Streptomyces lydicus]|uniref:hypothetical protein n=1 Tax=Streptomyces lydicus TaxID=47763 RepID=UPI0037AEDBB5
MNPTADNDPPTGAGTPTGPGAPADLPGPVAFQCVLLRRMADHHPGRVEDALRALGVTRAQMREANRRWQATMHTPRGRGVQPYRALLGAPESLTTRRIGDLTCKVFTWPVPLWPDMRFEVLTDERRGTVWNAWLVRAPGAAAPELRTAPDLAPWCCTVDEVARAFAPARPLEGSAPTRWRLACTAPGPDGTPEKLVAEFTWGLYQRRVD